MIGMIVAYSEDRVIGKNGVIPWKIPGEQKRFKQLTTGNICIMGKNTFRSLKRPLPDRCNIVVSKSENFYDPVKRLYTAKSLKDALNLLPEAYLDRYIIGGTRLYEEGLEYASTIYATEIECVLNDGDAYFPDFDHTAFDSNLIEDIETIGYVNGEETIIRYKNINYNRVKTII